MLVVTPVIVQGKSELLATASAVVSLKNPLLPMRFIFRGPYARGQPIADAEMPVRLRRQTQEKTSEEN